MLECKCYIKATWSTLLGVYQDNIKFLENIALRMEKFAPEEVADGMYNKCGTKIYPYLWEYIFLQFKKFNKEFRHVHAWKPTGVTHQEIINKTIAIHMRVTNTMKN